MSGDAARNTHPRPSDAPRAQNSHPRMDTAGSKAAKDAEEEMRSCVEKLARDLSSFCDTTGKQQLVELQLAALSGCYVLLIKFDLIFVAFFFFLKIKSQW
jgi:hypothetical protein